MTGDGGRMYDSFVVRVWRDIASGEMQRVEVEHIQTARIEHAASVEAGWILLRIVACLDETWGLGSSPSAEGPPAGA